MKRGDLVRRDKDGRVFRLTLVNDRVFSGESADGQWSGCGGPIGFLYAGYARTTSPSSATDRSPE